MEHESATTAAASARFTSRLEAFSDLVFGFSLSLLATRLEVPAQADDVFNTTRWATIIATFAFVCRFWLEHYRVFRHRFVARMFDAGVNFIFLFGIAIFPYAVQVFLRFQTLFSPLALYLGDLSLMLSSLAILRVRGLRQRRSDPDMRGRLRDWQRSVIHGVVAILVAGFLLALDWRGGSLQDGLRLFGSYLALAIIVLIVLTRRGIRRLPGFLA